MRRTIEWTVVILGALNGWVLTWNMVQYQLSFEESFLTFFIIPGFYFLEVLAICMIGIVALWTVDDKWIRWLWAGIGILFVLVVLGAWTIGAVLAITLILFVILAMSLISRSDISLSEGFKVAVKFFVYQAVLMIVLLQIHLYLILNI